MCTGEEIDHNHFGTTSPARGAPKSLYETGPRRQCGDEQAGRNIDTRFDHLRSDHKAVCAWRAGGTIQELLPPPGPFTGSEPAVNEAKVSALERFALPQCSMKLDGITNGVQHNDGWAVFSATDFQVPLHDSRGQGIDTLKCFHL